MNQHSEVVTEEHADLNELLLSKVSLSELIQIYVSIWTDSELKWVVGWLFAISLFLTLVSV